jgi:hypothetical protein
MKIGDGQDTLKLDGHVKSTIQIGALKSSRVTRLHYSTFHSILFFTLIPCHNELKTKHGMTERNVNILVGLYY